VSAMVGERADVLTGFPSQEMSTWGERFLVPFFTWASVCFTPLFLAYALKIPALSSAVGQMLFFTRDAYWKAGGHEIVCREIAEDLSLVRHARSAGLRWRMAYLSDLIICRMYSGGRQAFGGFSKNFFAAFNFRLLPYLFVFAWLAVMFWYPPIMLLLSWAGIMQGLHAAKLVISIILSLLLWVVPYATLGFGIRPALLYPVTMGMIEGVALSSVWLTITGKIRWKGRLLERQRWRWI
jgi:chlorobactene glucosyltransferase